MFALHDGGARLIAVGLPPAAQRRVRERVVASARALVLGPGGCGGSTVER
ncbi:MAG TPA: hypothetical protein VKD26_01410 [Streptosporangiaceae bacterium]|nr:hypothetical protein [Streptosporangiaceae bacterium]